MEAGHLRAFGMVGWRCKTKLKICGAQQQELSRKQSAMGTYVERMKVRGTRLKNTKGRPVSHIADDSRRSQGAGRGGHWERS
jgi:hypothetical protein